MESNPVSSSEDLQKTYERLQSNLNIVRHELDQALGVWRSILAEEKLEFKKLFEDQEQNWNRDQTQWQNEQEAYEKKIQELESFFNAQLKLTDQNAIRALNELDAAWKQERIRWQQTLTLQSKESHQRDDLQSVSQHQLEQRVVQLEEENRQLLSTQSGRPSKEGELTKPYQEEIAALQAQIADWEREKTAWQETLAARAQDLHEKEEAWQNESRQQEFHIQSLEKKVNDLEGQLTHSPETAEISPPPVQPPVETYVNALEMQISSLQDFVQKILPGLSLRKSDRLMPSPPSASGAPPRGSN